MSVFPSAVRPSFQLLESSVVSSAVASVDFVTPFALEYDEFELRFQKVLPVSGDVAAFIRFSKDSGATFDATGYVNGHVRMNGVSASMTASENGTTSVQVSNDASASSVSQLADYGGISGFARFLPSGTAGKKWVQFQSAFRCNFDGSMMHITGAGQWRGGSQALNGVRFMFSTGNIASGFFALYGAKMS